MFRACCESCSASLTIKDDSARGRRAKCPRCGEPTRLDPLEDEPAPDDLDEDGPTEPLPFPPRGTSPPPSTRTPPPRPIPSPGRRLARRLEWTAVAWECLAALSLIAAVGLVVLGVVQLTEAAESAEQRFAAAAATGRAYAAFASAGSSLFAVLVSWSVAGFFRAVGARLPA